MEKLLNFREIIFCKSNKLIKNYSLPFHLCMKKAIPVYQPDLFGNEKRYVNECLDSNWISSKGLFIERFENLFCEKLNIQFSTSVSNGTVALHLALLALGIGPEDEVIVPTLTYIASVNAIAMVGAKPVLLIH